jgi:hypothetical protein
MELHPGFPVVQGRYRLTRDCDLELPERFNRRIEDGDMVLWRPGLTFWIAIWGREDNRTAEETLAWILHDASPDRTNEIVERAGGLIRLTYRLNEEDLDRQPSRYVSVSGYVISSLGHVQISAYCDDTRSVAVGEAVIQSVRWLPTSP